MIRVIACLLLMMASAGCAAERSQALPDGPSGGDRPAATEQEASKESLPDIAPDRVVDESGEYEYVNTPFGFMKLKVSRPGAQAAPPEEKGKTRYFPWGSSPGEKVPEKEPVPEEKTTAVPDEKRPAAAAVPPVAEETSKEEKQEAEGGVTLNFDDADIYEVIRTFSEILAFNYIMDPGVGGRVTVHTAGMLGKADLFPVFYQILEANGLTAVKEGSLYRIIKMKESTRLPLLIRDSEDQEDLSPDQRVIMQIVPLRFISVQEMTKILTPFVSADGTILAHDGSNLLLLVDKGINVLKCLKLVEVFDADLFERVSHRFYFLQNTRAEDLAKILKEVLSSYTIGKKDDVSIVPIERLNAILLISMQKRVLDEMDSFLRELDIPSDAAEPQIYVYFVKNGEAKQIGELLESIFTEKKTDKKEELPSRVRTPTNPLSMAAVAQKTEEAAKPAAASPPPGPSAAGGAESESGAIRGEVSITTDEVRNALIIKALPRDYRIIEKVLLQLDIMPRQVLIEATIAEITLDKTTDLGVEWTFDNVNPVASFTGGLSAGIGATTGGLRYAVQLTERWKAALYALATDNKVNVLSSPHILASDNKEAKIDVSDEIPVASTSYETTSSTTTPVFETTIQYRDTGILLTVTPHINDTGMVTMDISQEVSDPAGSVKVAGKDYPAFTKRAVNTTLSVKHGQTLVIGGLIKETKSDSAGGVPCLIDVPVLRFLAGSEKKVSNKKELIIMITPRVIVSLEDVDAVTDEFKKKVKSVTRQFEEHRKRLESK